MTNELHLSIIKQKWKELENEPGVFQYNLNVLSKKRLGEFNFHAELNPHRFKLRRIPQSIPSLYQHFDHNNFNFNKIKSSEKLLDVPFKDGVVTFIINQSPLTCYHSLICPDLEKSHPQLITEEAIDFSVQFLLSIDELNFRIGYNSPGALASVNHLHLHLLYIDYDLYVDRGTLEPIGKNNTYRLHKSQPTEAICYILDDSNKQSMVKRIFQFIQFLCKHNIPHNLFITPDRTHNLKRIKLFVYARENHCVIKCLTDLNVACCEFSGYVAVGDSESYNNITEQILVDKIRSESGNVYSLIYKYLYELESS